MGHHQILREKCVGKIKELTVEGNGKNEMQ